MESEQKNLAAFKVLERWMPELEKAASARGQDPDRLLEDALVHALPRFEEVDIGQMVEEAKASGSTPVGDLDAWIADRKEALRKRLSGTR